MADEGIELRSPFPVVPPLKDSKWGDLPTSADKESRPVEPPKTLPDIGEEHPCPYFVGGPDLNFVKPREGAEKKKIPLPVKVLPQPVIETRSSGDEEAMFEQCLQECLHGVVWECVSQHNRDLSKEMFCALISSNPRKFTVDKETCYALRRKLFKKNNDPSWSEPCEPVDRLTFDVLSCQAYKVSKARYTVTNEAMSDFHREKVAQATSQRLVNLYTSDMEKKLRKQDSKELKQQPPRIAS